MNNTTLALSSVSLLLILAGSTVLLQKMHIPGLAAQIISAGSVTQYKSCISEFTKMDSNNLHIVTAQINSDSQNDAIIQYKNGPQCGTAGCIYELCLSNQNGTFDYVPLGFAGHSLQVQQTVNNGMHDLELNNDPNDILTWNDNSYTLNGN